MKAKTFCGILVDLSTWGVGIPIFRLKVRRRGWASNTFLINISTGGSSKMESKMEKAVSNCFQATLNTLRLSWLMKENGRKASLMVLASTLMKKIQST